jgi:glycosyltransferase involved in cell wall biosynthesis
MISIITPTYNREDLVQVTIKSIQAQTFTDWELIIVDDGSTDNTENILKPYLAADKRIKYVKKANSGQAPSLNVGVSHASREFIVFLDSDDEAFPNWLSTVTANLKEDTGILCVGAIRKFPDGTTIEEGMNEFRLFGKVWKLKFTCGSLFIRRTVFLEIGGYDAELRANIQTDLGYRLLSYLRTTNLKPVVLKEYLMQINAHDGERIRNNWKKRKEGSVQFINKHYRFIYENDRKEIANIYSSIAFSSYKLKERAESVKFLLKAIKHNPVRWVNYIRIFKYGLM